jgi:hypothetical protein
VTSIRKADAQARGSFRREEENKKQWTKDKKDPLREEHQDGTSAAPVIVRNYGALSMMSLS